nr:zinc finger, CCHC-type [Tanacetum cinerariifolium]
MVHYNHILKHKHVGMKPMQKWKKTLSPKGKEMLMKEVKENKAYNTSRVKNIAMVKVQKETVEAINRNDAEKVKYPEKVHVIADHMIEGTNDETWDRVWKGKDVVISNVQYTPEVSLNILSMDQLEEQGYIVKYNNSKCTLQYMFDEEMHGTRNSQRKGTKEEVIGPKDVISEYNRFLDDYFVSIDPKDESSLVKGLEDLIWNRKDTQDYVDEEYIILGGYLRVTLGDKWNTIAKLQGLTDGEEEAVKNGYRMFIDMVQTYYETAEKTWYEVKPKKEVVKGSGTASVKDPQGKSKELQMFTSNVIGGTKLRWRLRRERKETRVGYKETETSTQGKVWRECRDDTRTTTMKAETRGLVSVQQEQNLEAETLVVIQGRIRDSKEAVEHLFRLVGKKGNSKKGEPWSNEAGRKQKEQSGNNNQTLVNELLLTRQGNTSCIHNNKRVLGQHLASRASGERFGSSFSKETNNLNKKKRKRDSAQSVLRRSCKRLTSNVIGGTKLHWRLRRERKETLAVYKETRNKIRKLLDSTPDRFIQIVASIEQTSDLDDITLDEITGKLKAFEERIKLRKGGQDESQENLLFAQGEHSGKGRRFNKRGDQALSTFKEFRQQIEMEMRMKLRMLRTDRGGEFTSNEFTK